MAEQNRTHVVVTWEGDSGLSATSPQVPGWSFGRPTKTEFQADYHAALRDAGVLGQVIGHEQRRFVSPEGIEYILRIADDKHRPERTELAWRMAAVLQSDQRHSDLDTAAKNPMGEVTYICCIASDTVGWVAEQMDSRGDAVQVALAVADEMVMTTQFATEASNESLPWPSLADRGWHSDMTIGEVCQQIAAGERVAVLV
ncbi:hypothetical protein GCM10009789_49750 [Kribbella sancticallisti]|uniref:Uncharacterized protein n=1 Tax=Kribbella sancticallisti TaxID=460087 RepID=A0ABN2DXW5_9ACTN